MGVDFYVPHKDCTHIGPRDFCENCECCTDKGEEAPSCDCKAAFSERMGTGIWYSKWIDAIFIEWRKARRKFYTVHGITAHELTPESCACDWCRDFYVLFVFKTGESFTPSQCARLMGIMDKIRLEEEDFKDMTRIAMLAFQASVDADQVLMVV